MRVVGARRIGADQRPHQDHGRAGGADDAGHGGAEHQDAGIQERRAAQGAGNVDAAGHHVEREQQNDEAHIFRQHRVNQGGERGRCTEHDGDRRQREQRPQGGDLAVVIVPDFREQQRPEVAAARAELKAEQLSLRGKRLIFIDETSVTTKMVRHSGRAPRGERLVASVPHGHWKTLTFIAGLRINGLTAPYVIDGAMDGPTFMAYVEQVLAPTLAKGDVVFADNLRTHKIDGVRQAIDAVGATLRYLPAYSPDLNPIEMAFSKLKAALRKGAKRTVKELWRLIGKLVKSFTPDQCANYFRHAGYRC